MSFEIKAEVRTRNLFIRSLRKFGYQSYRVCSFLCLAAHFVASPQTVWAQSDSSARATAEASVNRSPAVIDSETVAYDPKADTSNDQNVSRTPASDEVDVQGSPELSAILAAGAPPKESLVPKVLRGKLQIYSTAMHGEDGKSGYFKSLGERFLQAEQKKDKKLRPTVNDPTVREALDRAIQLKAEVEKRLFDKSLSKEARLATLQAFVQDVLFPVRELLMMTFRQEDVPDLLKRINEKRKKSGLGELAVFDPIQVYFPRLPDEIAPVGSKQEALLSTGVDPRAHMGMRIDDLGNRENFSDTCRNQRRLSFDFDPITTLSRDIKALSTAVTKENYARGLKLMTLQMMIQQLNLHNANLGIETPIHIPAGCQQAAAGMIPDTLKLRIPDAETRKGALDAMLAANGFIAGTDEYRDYYLENVPADPEQGGFSGYLPFEHLRSAQRGLSAKRPTMVIADPNAMPGNERSRQWKDYLEPSFDDQTDFEAVFALKRSQALAELSANKTSAEHLKPILEKMLNPTSEPLTHGEGAARRELHVEGYSGYIVDKMSAATNAAHEFVGWNDKRVVCPAARAELEQNVVNLSLPRLDGPDAARRWGLAEMWRFAHFYKTVNNASLQRELFAGICTDHPEPKPKFCNEAAGTGLNKFLESVDSVLQKYQNEDPYLPKTPFEDETVRAYYPTLVRLWETARNAQTVNKAGKRVSLLPAAVQSEWKFLSARMDTSPWASQRLAYVVATKCGDLGQDPADVKAFEKLAFKLGLNSPLAPDHGNRILRSEEKMAIWKKIESDFNEASGHLFNAVADGSNVDTFDRLEKLHKGAAILSSETALANAKKNLGRVPKDVSADILQVAASADAQAGESLARLYAFKNSSLPADEKLKAQEDLIVEMSQKFNGLSSSDEAKLKLLDLDTSYKRPVFHQIIKEASLKRRTQLLEQLDKLCVLDPDKDAAEFKLLVRSTIHSQDQVNQLLGLPELPKSVKTALDTWAKADKDNMKLTGLQMAFFVGAAVLATGCVAGSGGACLPVAAAVLSAAATGTQIWIFKNSLGAAGDADENEQFTRAFEDLGYTTSAAVKESREGHGYMMASMDAAFALPLLGATAKSAQMGTRALVESRGGLMRALGILGAANPARVGANVAIDDLAKTGVGLAEKTSKQSLQSIAHETEIKASMYALGLHSLSDDLRKMGTQVLPALSREFLEPVNLEKLSESDVVKAFAKSVSKHYGNDPASLRKFFESYTGSRLQRIEESLAGYEAKYLEENPGLVRSLLAKTGVPSSRMEKLSLHLIYGKKMRGLVQELRTLEASGGNLEEFVAKNSDDIKEILMNLPLRKREIPYHVLMQGSPFSMSTLPGIKQTLGIVDEALQARKLAVAAENILFEVARKSAYEKLNLKPVVAVQTTYHLMSEFMNLVRADLNKAEEPLAVARVIDFQTQVAGRILEFQKATHPEATIPHGTDLVRILFSPKDVTEEKMAETLWNSTPSVKLFKTEELEVPADVLVRKLSNYSNTDQFENYVTALKVLTVTKRPSVITN